MDVYAAGNSDLNFVFDRYISTKTELRSTTYSNYTYTYDHFVRETFGKKLIVDIKYSDVLHFYLYLLKEKGIQVNTLDTVHSVLHPTFQMAVRDNIIRINPSDGVMAQVKKKQGKNHGVRHALTIEQQRAFMNYISENPVYCRWTPLFTVLLGTGCRIGEIIGLRWQDLDYEKRMISINHSVTYYPRREDTYKCQFEVSLPKTEAGIRNVPMLDEVYNAFKEEAVRQKEDGICNKMEVNGMSGLFLQIVLGVCIIRRQSTALSGVFQRIIMQRKFYELKEKNVPLLSFHIFPVITSDIRFVPGFVKTKPM